MEESKNPLKELSDAVKSAETGEARRLIDEVTELSYTIKKFSNDYKRFVEIKKEV